MCRCKTNSSVKVDEQGGKSAPQEDAAATGAGSGNVSADVGSVDDSQVDGTGSGAVGRVGGLQVPAAAGPGSGDADNVGDPLATGTSNSSVDASGDVSGSQVPARTGGGDVSGNGSVGDPQVSLTTATSIGDISGAGSVGDPQLEAIGTSSACVDECVGGQQVPGTTGSGGVDRPLTPPTTPNQRTQETEPNAIAESERTNAAPLSTTDDRAVTSEPTLGQVRHAMQPSPDRPSAPSSPATLSRELAAAPAEGSLSGNMTSPRLGSNTTAAEQQPPGAQTRSRSAKKQTPPNAAPPAAADVAVDPRDVLRMKIRDMIKSAGETLKVERVRGAHIEASLEAQYAVHALPETIAVMAKKQRIHLLEKSFGAEELRQLLRDAGTAKIYAEREGRNIYVGQARDEELRDSLAELWGAQSRAGGAISIDVPRTAIPLDAEVERAQREGLADFVECVRVVRSKADSGKILCWCVLITYARVPFKAVHRNESYLAALLWKLKNLSENDFEAACAKVELTGKDKRSRYVKWGALVNAYPVFGKRNVKCHQAQC